MTKEEGGNPKFTATPSTVGRTPQVPVLNMAHFFHQLHCCNPHPPKAAIFDVSSVGKAMPQWFAVAFIEVNELKWATTLPTTMPEISSAISGSFKERSSPRKSQRSWTGVARVSSERSSYRQPCKSNDPDRWWRTSSRFWVMYTPCN